MGHEVSYEASDDLVKYCTTRYFLKRSAKRDLLGVTLIGIGVGLSWHNGFNEWYEVALATGGAVAVLMLTGAWLVYRHRMLSGIRECKDRTIRLRFEPESLFAESELGQSQLKWSAVKKIWRFDRAWLVFFSNTSYLMIPTAALNTDAAAYLVDRVKENGARVL